jgi:hypothetical protein
MSVLLALKRVRFYRGNSTIPSATYPKVVLITFKPSPYCHDYQTVSTSPPLPMVYKDNK